MIEVSEQHGRDAAAMLKCRSNTAKMLPLRLSVKSNKANMLATPLIFVLPMHG